MYKLAKAPIASLLAVALFGQSLAACSAKQSSVQSRIMARTTETELDSSRFDSDNEVGANKHDVTDAGSGREIHEWFHRSDDSQASEGGQEATDEKVKQETERVRQGETTGDLSVARGASSEARNELMREMTTQTEKRIDELKKELRNAGIDVPDDGPGPGGSSSSAKTDNGDSSSDSNGDGHPDSSPHDLVNVEKRLKAQLETQIETTEKAVTRLEQERRDVEKRAGETRKELDNRRAESEKLKNEADATQGRIESNGRTSQPSFEAEGQGHQARHSTGIRSALGALPAGLTKATIPREGDGTRPEDDLPDSPAKTSIKHERRKITFLEDTSTTPESKKAFERTHDLLDAAAKYANDGDSERAKRRQQEAEKLANQAAGMAGRSLGGVPDDDGLDRGQVESTALDLYDAGSELDALGLGTVADLVIEHASDLMTVAYEGTRMIGALDVAASAMEAFTGKTLDFGDNGEPFLRDATDIERAIAVVDVALTAGGAIFGGPAGAIAAGMVGNVAKAMVRKEGKKAAKGAAEKAAKEGLGAAEKEAAEKAAKDVAEKEAERIAKEAAKIPKELEELGDNAKNWSTKPPNPKNKAHPNGLNGPLNALKHATDHMKEFPECLTEADYVKKAQDFLSNPPAGALQKNRANGDVIIYEQSTNTLGVKNAAGQPRTMFKPTDGKPYYDRQK